MANDYTVSVKNNNTIQSKTKYAMWPLTGTATPQEVSGDFTLDSTVVGPGVLMAASYNAQCTNRPYSVQVNTICCPYTMIAYEADIRYPDISIAEIGIGQSITNPYVPFTSAWRFTKTITSIPNSTFPNERYTSICIPRTVINISSDPFGSLPTAPQVVTFIFCHNSKIELQTLINNSGQFLNSLPNETSFVFINEELCNIFVTAYPQMKTQTKLFSDYLKSLGKTVPDISKL